MANPGQSQNTDKPAIAVLPFESLDAESAYPFLGAAIAEEVITTLSRTPQLRVIARGSSFQYQGSVPDVRTVAKELGVRYVLQGSVRIAGDRARIQGHLSDASTGDEIWAERYDRSLDDVFAVQDEISMEIATNLEVKLGFGEQARVWRRDKTSLDAYEHFMKVWEEYLKFNRQANKRARREALAALGIDPEFAAAYAALGLTYATEAQFGWGEDRQESLDLAREAANEALARDPDMSDANALLGRIYMLEGDYDEAIATTGRALEEAPSNAWAYHLQAMNMLFAGRFEEAIEADRQVFLLWPLADVQSDNARVYLAAAYCQLGRFGEALEELDAVVAVRPSWLSARTLRVVAYDGLGRSTDARDEARRILGIKPAFSTSWWASLNRYRNEADLEVILDPLRRAGLPELAGGADLSLEPLEEDQTAPAHRVLRTVLFTDIVSSTELASKLGDRRWRDTIDSHDEMARRTVEAHSGRVVKSTGDGTFAVFESPGDAIRCAEGLAAKAVDLGFRLRAGVHTGEIEIRGDDLAGIAVHIAARVAARAEADEILVTRTVQDLVTGGDFAFDSHGSTVLRGVPGDHELFAVREKAP